MVFKKSAAKYKITKSYDELFQEKFTNITKYYNNYHDDYRK